MNKDKLLKYETYKNLILEKLAASLPEKHKNRSNEYKAFLTKELNDVKTKIERFKTQ